MHSQVAVTLLKNWAQGTKPVESLDSGYCRNDG